LVATKQLAGTVVVTVRVGVEITCVNVPLTGVPTESVTVTKKVTVPGAVGVPLKMPPDDIVKPAAVLDAVQV
jgi:hypothetical protein